MKRILKNRQGEGNNGWQNTQKPEIVGTCYLLWADWKRRGNRGAGAVRAGTGEGEQPRWSCSHGRTGLLPDIWHCNKWENIQIPQISCQGLPLAKPSLKAVGSIVHRYQHPRTEQSNKDGEWVGEQPANQQFHVLDTPLRNPCTFVTRCAQKDMHKDVFLSIVYISKTLCSLGRKLYTHEEERARCYLSN